MLTELEYTDEEDDDDGLTAKEVKERITKFQFMDVEEGALLELFSEDLDQNTVTSKESIVLKIKDHPLLKDKAIADIQKWMRSKIKIKVKKFGAAVRKRKPDFEADSEGNTSQEEEEIKTKRRKKSRRVNRTKKSWSQDEIEAVMNTLGHFVKSKLVPGKEQILIAKETSAALENRTWQQIKYYIDNVIRKQERNELKLFGVKK